MNSEIEVGEYIRTKDGVIAKVTRIDISMVDCDRDVFDLDNGAMMEIPCEYIQEYIVKHSPNLIDLIEVGDYVNGQYIVEKFYDYANKEWNIVTALKEYLKFGKSRNDIKKVATKEQFKSIEYEV